MKIWILALSVCMCVHAQLDISDPAQKSGEIVGTISIPSIKLNQVIRSGVDMSIIDLGVAYWPGSGKPGESGNMVLAGHRTVKTAPFFNIEKLRFGDFILIESKDGVAAKYRVREMFVVHPVKDFSIVVSSPEKPEDAILTMFACHPLYSDAKRFVVRARLVREGQ